MFLSNINRYQEKNNLLSITINLVLSFLFYLFLIINWYSVSDRWPTVILCLACIMLAIQMMSLILKRIPIFDFRYWYSVLCFVFTYGRIFIIAFDLEDRLIWQNLSMNYSDLQSWQAGLLSLVCIQCLFSGMLWTPKKTYLKRDGSLVPNRRFFLAGLVLIVLLLPFKIVVDYQNYILMKASETYAQAEVNGVVGNLSLLFPLGFVLIVFSGKISKYKCLLFIFFYAVLMLFFSIYTGDRRNVITSIIALFLTYFFVYKPKVTFFKVILFILLSTAVLYLLVVIRELRSSGSGSLKTVFEFLSANPLSFMDILIDSFSEYGITYYTYANAIKFYPTEINFFYGSSYVLWIVLAIPGIGVILPAINDITSTSKYPESVLGYSVGGSFGQEAYANFGLLAGVFLFLLGLILISRIICLYKKGKKQQLYYFVFVYFLMSLPRASIIEFSRQIIWSIVLIEVCLSIFYKKRDVVNAKNSINCN